MSSSSNKPIFISIFDDFSNVLNISKARWYQEEAYYHFMNSEKDKESYHFPDGIKFDIIKFHSNHFQRDYHTFCSMITEDNRMHLLSSNEENLRSFSIWYNRVRIIEPY